MIIRGSGTVGVAGFTGAAACICATVLSAGASTAGGAMSCAAGTLTRGATPIACGAVPAEDDTGVAVVAAGAPAGTLGGITTTVGGRCPAATEAGVTNLGASGAAAGTSRPGFCGAAFDGVAGASAFASFAGVAAGAFAAGRAAGRSAASFNCVMARSTSPGREICERSILVLMPSSPGAVRAVFDELGAASERPPRCLRTRSAS